MNDLRSQPNAPQRWIFRLAPWLIIVAALGYYGSYIGFWFNPHDEGGTAALTAMRLLQGEAPIRDVELGYNVGWFWPIVGLFKLVGVNFLAMRGYFFFLSTITALLGWLTIRRLTRNEWLALAGGIALVIFPGSQFKNYIPLLCVANTLCVLNTALAPVEQTRRFWWRVGLGGIVLGITFLIRIDLGYLFTLVWLGFLGLQLLDVRHRVRERLMRPIASLVMILAALILTHAPLWAVAKAGGYDSFFVAQYGAWARSITNRAETVVRPAPNRSQQTATNKASAATIDRSTLRRVTLEQAKATDDPGQRVLFALTYLPPLVYLLGLAWCAFNLLKAITRKTFTLDQPSTLVLLALIGSLATFPQFFFFRPDRPHLSEFMPGYIVATLCAAAVMTRGWRWLLSAVLVLQFGLFANYAMDHYSAGTIAARTKIKRKKRVLFEGANGVRVWVHKEKDYPEFEGVRRVVVENSRPGDWLVCYPYQPGYNVMTDRPTYQHNVYQDNATTAPHWPQRTVKELTEKKPAVVIIDDRAINRTEASRFSVWAKPAYDFVRENYELRETFGTVQVFARRNPTVE